MWLINADRFIHEVRSRVSDIIFRGVEATMVFGGDSCNTAEWTRGYEAGTIAVANMIELQPTIEAEPVKHGRWAPVDGEEPCDEWDCTACGKRRTFLCEMDADDMKEDFPRCPNCGAKMDLEG